jgi:hypothetical protein
MAAGWVAHQCRHQASLRLHALLTWLCSEVSLAHVAYFVRIADQTAVSYGVHFLQ